MPGSIIKNIKNTLCGWDGKILGKSTSTRKGHSHKDLMKCLYKSNMEVFQLRQTMSSKDNEIKGLQQELAKYLVEEQEKKGRTGIMDVKEPIDLDDKYKMKPEDFEDKTRVVDAPPLNTGKDKAKNDKELAKDLLEAEKNE